MLPWLSSSSKGWGVTDDSFLPQLSVFESEACFRGDEWAVQCCNVVCQRECMLLVFHAFHTGGRVTPTAPCPLPPAIAPCPPPYPLLSVPAPCHCPLSPCPCPLPPGLSQKHWPLITLYSNHMVSSYSTEEGGIVSYRGCDATPPPPTSNSPPPSSFTELHFNFPLLWHCQVPLLGIRYLAAKHKIQSFDTHTCNVSVCQMRTLAIIRMLSMCTG